MEYYGDDENSLKCDDGDGKPVGIMMMNRSMEYYCLDEENKTFYNMTVDIGTIDRYNRQQIQSMDDPPMGGQRLPAVDCL